MQIKKQKDKKHRCDEEKDAFFCPAFIGGKRLQLKYKKPQQTDFMWSDPTTPN